MDLKKVQAQLKTQEDYLEKLMISLDKKKVNYKENKTFLFERAKLIGMMEVSKTIGIDVIEFTWVYNAV